MQVAQTNEMTCVDIRVSGYVILSLAATRFSLVVVPKG